ncbi:MAG: uracil-DNA glycosylase [Candidatus Sericytochromatia bacterium]
MCSTQLNLFSSDLPEDDKKDDSIKNSAKEHIEEVQIQESEIIENLTEEDIKVNHLIKEFISHENINDDIRNEYNQKLKEIAINCKKCVLSKTRTQVVYSAGNINAPIMIIGEGPGENEDLSGIPFVGKAGQLLDKILASGGISREDDVYISNVVKCRPPKNRTPVQEEVDACSIYLNNQLKLIKAKIILLAGSTATNAFLKETLSITKVRGNWIERDDKWIMPIFHPSYLLRNASKDVGSPKWLMWQDIKKVKQKLQDLKEI